MTRNALSQLSLGSLGWFQASVLVVIRLLSIADAMGMRERLRDTTGGTWAPRLIGCSAPPSSPRRPSPPTPVPGPRRCSPGPATSLSMHGAVHMLSAVVGFLALCAAFLVLARHFTTHGRRRWAIASRLVPVGVFVGFAASSAAAVLACTAGAGLGLLWLTAVSIQLLTSAPAPTTRP